MLRSLRACAFQPFGTHRLRDEWEATRREVQALFEKACADEYERRLDSDLDDLDETAFRRKYNVTSQS